MRINRQSTAMLFFAWSLVALNISCTKKVQKDASMSFSLPPHPNISSKSLSASAAQPGNFCYIIQIRGSGLSSSSKSCYPEKGITTEPLPPLSTVQLQVARGPGRIVELFGYIPRSGETCLTAPRSWHELPLNRLFSMARVENVSTEKDQVEITLGISFPGIQNHLGVSQQTPTSCYANLPPILVDADVNAPTPVLNGTNHSIKGNVVSAASAPAMSGSRFQIHQANVGAIDAER